MLILIQLLFLIVQIYSNSLNILVLYSDLTPYTLKIQIESSLQGSIYTSLSHIPSLKAKYSTLTISSSAPLNLPQMDPDILIDFTFSPHISQTLSTKAISQDFLHLIPNRPINTISGELPSLNTLYLTPCYTTEASAMRDLIKKFEWKKIIIIYDSNYNNIQQAKYLKEITQGVTFELELLIEDSWRENSGIVETTVKNVLKGSEGSVFFMFTNKILASLILKAADLNGIGGSGYVWVVNENAMIGLEEVCEDSSVMVPYEFIGIIKSGVIGFISENSELETKDPLRTISSVIDLVFKVIIQISSTKGSQISNYVKQDNKLTQNIVLFNSNGLILRSVYIYNIFNFAKFNIASWDYSKKTLIFNSRQIIWPGGDLITSSTNIHSIKLGIISPESTDLEANYVKLALDLAFTEINSNNFLGTEYELKAIYQNPLPLSYSLITSSIKQFEALNVVGYISPYTSDLTRIYALALAKDLYPKPIASYSASAGDLSDSSTYPSFIRLIQQDGFEATTVAMLISKLKYRKVGLIASDDMIGVTMYNSFIENIKTLKITVVNSLDNRKVRTSFKKNGKVSSKAKDDIDKVLSEMVREQLKVIVFLGNKKLSPEIAKIAFEKELYGDDYAWFGGGWIDETVLMDIEENYKSDKKNIMKVFKGAFSIAQNPVYGTKGNNFAMNYLEKTGFNYTTLAMLAYDTVYLYAYTIKSMISDNQDFTDGQTFINALRGCYFIGVSGTVEFASETNDRTSYGYSIMNMQNSELTQIYLYSPQSTITFINNSYAPIQFYDTSEDPPSDTWSKTYDCPFAEHMSKISVQGVSIVIAIGMFLFGITLAISFRSYSKWKQVEIIKISQPVIRSWKDNFVQAQIAIEFFQFIAIAPVLQSLEIVLNTISNIFMLDVLKVTSSDKQNYWVLLVFVCIFSYFWIFVVIIISTNAEQLLLKYQFSRKIIGIINSAYLPFIGNTMFLPFTSLLFDAFVCDHQAQNKPFVTRDCYMTCWENDHIPYMILSGLALILYVPVSVFLRPLWQQAKTGLNLKIQPFFLLLKTCFQILLVSVSKSLQGISPLANGIIFIAIFFAFGVTTLKIQPFNYNRCNLWEISSIIAVCYYSIIATVSQIYDPTNVLWFIGLVIGWLLILGVTIIWQKKTMPDFLMASVMMKPKRSLKEILSHHKVTSVADAEMRKSMNSEFFRSKVGIDISNEMNENSFSRIEVVDINDEKNIEDRVRGGEEVSFR